MHVYKVIIVGAGVAGLAAAKFLHEHGFHDFLILEAQDKIGGRIDTREYGNTLNEATDSETAGIGSIVELGAQWIHGEENNFYKLVQANKSLHGKTSWEGEGDFLTPTGEIIPRKKVQKILDWVETKLDEIEELSEFIPESLLTYPDSITQTNSKSDTLVPNEVPTSSKDIPKNPNPNPNPVSVSDKLENDKDKGTSLSPNGSASNSSQNLAEATSVGAYLRQKFESYLNQPYNYNNNETSKNQNHNKNKIENDDQNRIENDDNDDGEDLTPEIKLAIFQWAMSFQRIDNSCNQMTNLSLRRWPEFEINAGELYNNFKCGAQHLVNTAFDPFLNVGNLKLNSPVTKINWQTEEIQVFYKKTKPVLVSNEGNAQNSQNSQNSITAQNVTTNNDKDGDQESFFLCQTVIVTCSIGVLQHLKPSLFQPALPQNISEAIDWTGFGPVTKLFVEWDEPWWPKDCRGYQLLWPQEFINCCDDEEDDDDNANNFNHSKNDKEDSSKVKNILDNRWFKSITGFDPILENPNVLLAWLGGPEAVYLESQDENIISKTCEKYLKSFTGIDVPTPKSVLVSKWNSNPYIRGAYSYRSTAGDQVPGDIATLLKLPIYNVDDVGLLKPALIFAGEALHRTHYSTLHGAYASGEEQAELLLELFKQWQEERDKVDLCQ